jgi:hypothetical protein
MPQPRTCELNHENTKVRKHEREKRQRARHAKNAILRDVRFVFSYFCAFVISACALSLPPSAPR